MKVVDISDPNRVNRVPDSSVTLFSEKDFSEHGFKIKKIELRLFIEKTDENLGPYSLITSFVRSLRPPKFGSIIFLHFVQITWG